MRAPPAWSTFHLGAEVTEVGQDDDKVFARAIVNGERQEFEGRYLIGADGAHSVVRRTLGFPLEGFTYEHSTTLITTPFRFEDEIPELVGANYTWTWLDAGSMFRLRDEWRCTFYPRPGEADVDLTDDVIESRMQGILKRPEPYEVREKRNYKIHQRIVPDYRKGRIVLAGDAAHVTPPTGGLGMNGGIHDAVNLAEKLARVCNGEVTNCSISTRASGGRWPGGNPGAVAPEPHPHAALGPGAAQGGDGAYARRRRRPGALEADAAAHLDDRGTAAGGGGAVAMH